MELRARVEQILERPAMQVRPSKADTPSAGVLPFLKWAGGKRWLMPLALELQGHCDGTYVEPFLGSGAMFFGLRPPRALLSDSNTELVETYKAIATEWQAVRRKLAHHDRLHSADYYYTVRASRPTSLVGRAAKFIYLNRTCWNGLYRVNQAGIFNTPIGTKKRAVLDSDDFESVARLLEGAVLEEGDFETKIDRAGAGDLVFADPPYTVRHQFNGFIKYNEQLFSWADQERLRDALHRAKMRGAVVMCTNADHASIRELYEGDFRLFPLSRYSAIAGAGGVRGKYAEILALG
ncbi:Dam family site-specific DNA-(adenine-N6)-methyltransferase [Stenotrophomonas maltophilia]|uniref:DNA adenine methylase n=1 Tax=Stenotrophomonas TaxID=40323 RepID=UPI0018D48C93|nr:Dam family site-specific DNA-(adenine-N6)-methyltransferase [Stenotrophomonas maltophilia]MBH1558467.1 Dam family site-specific DNA-(adenine-N6)-methyltransferase [Stenotrophomonas maltophilia]